MTTEQIERQVERDMDRLDFRLLNGDLDQNEYNTEVRKLDYWADEEYRSAKYPKHIITGE